MFIFPVLQEEFSAPFAKSLDIKPIIEDIVNRRSFLALTAALAALGLPGCGSDTANSSFAPTSGGGGLIPAAQEIQGRIAPELVFSGAEMGSAYGPSTITGNTFTTSISSSTVGLLALGDSAGKVRGFTLTFPGETPVFSAESSALAILFMEPGRLKLDPTQARAQIADIRASSFFAPFVQLLLTNASSPLDFLSGDSAYVAALDSLVGSLGNPFTSAPPGGSLVGTAQVRLTNPSPRFLRVTRRDAQGTRTLSDFLPAYGTLVDPGDGKTLPLSYDFEGLGPVETLPSDTGLIESTYWPTFFFTFYIPLIELAAGQRVRVDAGLELMRTVTPPAFDPRADLASQVVLSRALVEDAQQTLSDVAEVISQNLEALPKLITEGAYPSGLAFSLAALMKFKEHKDNPTHVTIGAPVSMLLIAAALLFLPSILNVAGYTMFGDSSNPAEGPTGSPY